MSSRLGIGRSGQHDPMLKGIEQYNKEHAKKEKYVRATPRSQPINNIYDNRFEYEPFGAPGRNPTNLITAVTIVIIIVGIIILIAYYIHLKKTGKERDSEYFKQFTMWGANDNYDYDDDDYDDDYTYDTYNNNTYDAYNNNTYDDDEPVDIISEEPIFDSMSGGNANKYNNGLDITDLVSSNKQRSYII